MNWQKLIAYSLGGIALVVLGWLLHSTFIPKPTNTVTETVRYDTAYVDKPPIVVEDTKYIDRPVYKDSVRTYYDITSGEQDSTKYSIQHWMIDDSKSKVKSDWIVYLDPIYKIVKEYITRDSVQTRTEVKYISQPFFLNP